jgi:hypothetical protein
MRFKFTFILVLFLVVPIIGFSQYYEYGIGIGGANYKGDLVFNGVILKETHPMIEFNYKKFNPDSRFRKKAFMKYYTISGADSNYAGGYSRDYLYREKRNLSFFSNCVDAGIGVEFNMIEGKFRFLDNNYYHRFYGGFSTGIMYFEPQTTFQGKQVKLRDIQTESEKYLPVTITFPFSLGWETEVSKHLSYGIELSYQFTLSDRLDDVSGYYADMNDLKRRGGADAIFLSYRNLESLYPNISGNFISQNNKPKALRGDPNDRDGVLMLKLYVQFGGWDPLKRY